jgi:2'-5' RNA ligase
MGNESALIVPIPEVERIVGQLRVQYDPAARLGVPAHITLLYPFRPAETAINEINTLRTVCAPIEAFAFAFTDIRRFPATAYLHPDRSQTFVEMTKTILNQWPDCQPYGGAFTDVVPHLTVADKVGRETLEEVEKALRPQLPINCVAREIWLLASDGAGIWSKAVGLKLASSPG